MTDSEHDAATAWVADQLRYPQRLPRTTTVLDWRNVPGPVQQKLEDVARVYGSVDYDQLPRRRWLRNRGPALTSSECLVVDAAATQLRWPANLDCDETRLLTIVEGVVDRVTDHPAWDHQVVRGCRSRIALHMELHSYATAANELLKLRMDTPELSSHADRDSYVRKEWDRRQVAFAHSRASLIERAATMRVVEAGLDKVHMLVEDLRTIEALAVDAPAVDGLYRHLAAAEVAATNTHAVADDLRDAAENLQAQLSCLGSFGRRHRA